MNKVRKAQFESLIGMVRDANASLRGCLLTERDNEAAVLTRCVKALRAAVPVRFNANLESRRSSQLEYACAVLTDFGYGIG